MQICYFEDSRGHQDVYEWLLEIKMSDPSTYRRAYLLQKVLSQIGDQIHAGLISYKGIKKLKGTFIWQLRANKDRIMFFFFNDDCLIITNHFKKKKNKTPRSEIELAETRAEQWKFNHLRSTHKQ